MRRQQAQGKFPDDTSFSIGEAVEFVHHHCGDIREVERLGMQQAIEQDLRDDDQHAGFGIDSAITGYQTHIVRAESPAGGRRLHLAKLLVGQCDQRGRIVRDLTRVQRLKQSRFRDQRLAHAGRGADQDPLFGGEPGQQRLFLYRIRLVRQLVEVHRRQLVTVRSFVAHVVW